MHWEEVKNFYPDKWIVYVSVNQQMKNNVFGEEKLIVIEVLDNINEAYRCFCRLNKNKKNIGIRIANTSEDELIFEFKKTSNSYSFKRSY